MHAGGGYQGGGGYNQGGMQGECPCPSALQLCVNAQQATVMWSQQDSDAWHISGWAQGHVMQAVVMAMRAACRRWVDSWAEWAALTSVE